GIPLYVSSSWVFVAALYTWTVYINLTETRRLAAGSSEAVLLSVFAAVLFFGSILIHETAHAVMARGLDLPVRSITLVFFGGATETRSNARGPLGEFLVSFVGPASTLLLAGVFTVIHRATSGVASELVGYLAWLQLIFAAANALPGFPLDGGRMLLAVVWGLTKDRRTALQAAGWSGIFVGSGLIAAAFWSLTHGGQWWLFLGYVGLILISTGRGMGQRIVFRDRLMTGHVSEAMRPAPPTVPADMTLGQALDHVLRGTVDEGFPVLDAGRVIGSVSMRSARRVGVRDPMRPVRDALIPLNQMPVLDPGETLDEAFEWLGGQDGLVVVDGVPIGALGPKDVEHWYRRVVEGRTSPTGFAALPPRPDL
ncbi:MAG: site-2 protease family protein, partial [Acidimicrobiia bacterium]